MSILIQEIEQYLGIKKPDLKTERGGFHQANIFFEADTAEQLDADQDGDIEAQEKGWNPMVCRQHDSRHATKAVDPHYYQAQGEEPPSNHIGAPSPFVGLVSITTFGVCGFLLWLAWVTLWPDFIKLLLWVAGR